jgi:hypothetical protein
VFIELDVSTTTKKSIVIELTGDVHVSALAISIFVNVLLHQIDDVLLHQIETRLLNKTKQKNKTKIIGVIELTGDVHVSSLAISVFVDVLLHQIELIFPLIVL